MSANAALAIQRYAKLAREYDASCKRMDPIRTRTIQALNLRKGDVVIDVCCGTGKSFLQIEQAIGPSGRIIGIEQSPDMMALARERVAAGGWRNVTLLETSVQAAPIPARADALLFNYTHDVLQSRQALSHVFNHAQAGCRVAVSGTKFFPWYLWPANLFVYWRSREYLTTFAGISKPYQLLEEYVIGWHTETTFGGMGYIGRGVHPGALPRRFARLSAAEEAAPMSLAVSA